MLPNSDNRGSLLYLTNSSPCLVTTNNTISTYEYNINHSKISGSLPDPTGIHYLFRMIEYRIANPADMNGVLALQSRYLAANLSEEEKKNGFVTTPFTETQLLGIIALNGLYVARDDHGIFAYLFAGNWQYFSQWEIFRYMISRFPDLRFRDKPITVEQSFQYGPVCIDIPYRSKGHLQQLFEKMRCDLLKKYPVSITFINQANDLSVAAHTKKLGWTIIEEFEFNNNQYFTLAFDMHQSVL